MRLIDADAFIRFLAEQRVKNTGMFTKGVNKALNVAISALKNQQITPTVDAVPVVRFQEREKAVVQLRKKWQDAEMFICTMCGHFDHNIVGNIVYGNKNCGEIVGYPCCKKFTPWIPCSERPPEELEPVNVVWVNHRPEPYYGKIKDVPQKATAVYYRGKWYWWSCVCEDFLAEYGRNEPDLVDSDIEITHWMPLPEPPKEEQNETD